jgi:hypothetical protein
MNRQPGTAEDPAPVTEPVALVLSHHPVDPLPGRDTCPVRELIVVERTRTGRRRK